MCLDVTIHVQDPIQTTVTEHRTNLDLDQLFSGVFVSTVWQVMSLTLMTYVKSLYSLKGKVCCQYQVRQQTVAIGAAFTYLSMYCHNLSINQTLGTFANLFSFQTGVFVSKLSCLSNRLRLRFFFCGSASQIAQTACRHLENVAKQLRNDKY